MTDNRKIDVLLVDDDAAVRESLKFVLEMDGFNVHAYESASELLAKSLAMKVDCVVTDYRMPFMSGLDLITSLHARTPDLPIIFITSLSDKALESRALGLGARAVLEKPFSDDVLAQTIRRVTGRA